MTTRELPDPESRWERTLPRAEDLRSDSAWQALGLPGPDDPAEVEVLSGGQANICIRVRDGRGERLLRRYLRDPSASAIERALLGRDWKRLRVPRVLSSGEDHLWLEFIHHGGLPESYEGGLAAGLALAEIHGSVFRTAGFLDERLQVQRPIASVYRALYAHIESRSIDASLKERVLAHWERNQERLVAAGSDIVLLHGDFKPSNLGFTDRGELLALDWEFAWAGPASLDIGQILRYNPSSDFVEGLLASYSDRAPVDRVAAEIFDLVNLASLLHDQPEGSRRARDVRERIEITLGQAPLLRSADSADRAWINARYDDLGFLPSTHTETLLCALFRGERIGAGRVIPVAPSVGELGGIYVAPTHRSRGLGARIVRALQERAEQSTLFCIPFERLREMYEAAGFQPVEDSDTVPAAVARKRTWCETAYPEPVCLLVWRRT